MAVQIRIPTVLREHAGGQSSVTAEGSTVGEVFADVVRRYPNLGGQLVTAEGSLHRFVNVYRNDEDVRFLSSLQTPVTDADVISILPAVAGG